MRTKIKGVSEAQPITMRLKAPDDWHLHLREGDRLPDTVKASATGFRRAIIMPNLSIPVTTVDLAERYHRAIRAVIEGLPDHLSRSFEPLMTLYLTDQTSVAEIDRAAQCPFIYAVKMYPRHATTGSADGVSAPEKLDEVFARMAEQRLPLLIHGEVTDPAVDIYDRERMFLDRVLEALAEKHPELRISLEHVSCSESVEFVKAHRQRMMATITPHHLWFNRNAVFPGSGINPHHHCLPVLKRERHRLKLIEAATSGLNCFAAGTDSAPHARSEKESACGCAGIFNAPCALETYVEVFERAGALNRLESFLSRNGANFYGLPLNDQTIELQRQAWSMPQEMSIGEQSCVPFRAGETIAWRQIQPRQN